MSTSDEKDLLTAMMREKHFSIVAIRKRIDNGDLFRGSDKTSAVKQRIWQGG